MTIIIVNDFGFVNGGASKVALDSAIGLKQAGYRVILFTAVGPVLKKLSQADIEIVCTGQSECLKDSSRIRGALRGLWNIKVYREMVALLRTLDTEDTIVHLHSWTKALSSSVIVAVARLGFKIVVTGHDYFLACPNGGFFDYKRRSICKCRPMSLNCCLKNCDKRSYVQKIYRLLRKEIQTKAFQQADWQIMYISNFSRAVLERHIHSQSAEYFVRNPVTAAPLSNYAQRWSDGIYYLFIGRLDPEKGVDMFCKAIKNLGLNGIVIGSGSQEVELRETYEGYQGLTFTGWLHQSEWKSYLEKAKCLVFPSRWYENAPLTIPEVQMFYRIPAVVPDMCAAREFIVEGYNGLLFKSGNQTSLENVVWRIEQGQYDFYADSKSISRKMYTADEYALDTHIRKLMEIYPLILGHERNL